MGPCNELRVFEKMAIGLSIAIGLSALVTQANAQSSPSIRGPGDTTLHGNPDCDRWLTLDSTVKNFWLDAILSPINMTYMLREKPTVDRYVALPSLAPVAEYVDTFCVAQPKSKAMSAALSYFEVLVKSPAQ
jgi:hypothetical protein